MSLSGSSIRNQGVEHAVSELELLKVLVIVYAHTSQLSDSFDCTQWWWWQRACRERSRLCPSSPPIFPAAADPNAVLVFRQLDGGRSMVR